MDPDWEFTAVDLNISIMISTMLDMDSWDFTVIHSIFYVFYFSESIQSNKFIFSN